jgi:glutamate decarboxylase
VEEPQADKLYAEAFDKNMIDKDEYPQTAAIEERCVHILADLWNSPQPHSTIGASAIGPSGALHAGGTGAPASVACPEEGRRQALRPAERRVQLLGPGPYLTPERMLEAVDENTIGVVPILGVTYNGLYEPVKELAAALDDLAVGGGPDVPIHVDGASGGMIAPFLDPDLEWDFRVSRVHSISTPGHKFRLVYPGLGWVIWAKRGYLPDELIFNVSYLGGDMPTLAVNFSRPGGQVLLQYYNFLRLGREGYRRVHQA